VTSDIDNGIVITDITDSKKLISVSYF